jgi:hypothetical protein
LIDIFNVVIPILEIVKLVFIFSLFRLLLSRSKIRPPLKFALSGVVESVDSALLEADYVSSLEGGVFNFAVYFS